MVLILERYLPGGFTASAAAKAPSLAMNRDDALQDMLIRKVFRRAITRPTHFVPTAEGFAAAVRAGLGWGMFPEHLAAPQLSEEAFLRIFDTHLDVPLYSQCWKLDSPIIKRITDAVRVAAADLSRVSLLFAGRGIYLRCEICTDWPSIPSGQRFFRKSHNLVLDTVGS
jgi:LysR family transcriptional regulator, chromosome initiation inhibitor